MTEAEPTRQRRATVTVVTPNPAVDVTYEVPEPRWHEVNRVARVTRRAGGKGINVAQVLRTIGVDVRATGFVGGHLGAELHDLLGSAGISQDWVSVDGQTRSTTAVYSEAGTTLLNEPGPTVGAEDWAKLANTTVDGLASGDVLVMSGSCPPGTTAADVTDLLTKARAAGATVLVDTSGPLLVAAAAVSDVLKPNEEELLEATGTADLESGAAALLSAGARAIVVSSGSRGMDLFAPATVPEGSVRRWHADPAAVVAGNPTGAGDAATAGLARALLNADEPAETLATGLPDAVALGAAAVLAPVAGVVDLADYDKFRSSVEVEKIS